MGLILDTDHLVFAERRGLTAFQAIERLGRERSAEELAISAMSVAELRHGIRRSSLESQRKARQKFLDDVLLGIDVVAMDSAIALRVGMVVAELEMAGKIVGLADIIIGCTALELGFGVATMNAGDFGRIPGLVVTTLIDRNPSQT